MEVRRRRPLRLQDAAVVHFGSDLQQGSRPAGGHFWLNDWIAVQHRPPRRQLAAGHVHQQRFHLGAHFRGHSQHADPLFWGHARPGKSPNIWSIGFRCLASWNSASIFLQKIIYYRSKNVIEQRFEVAHRKISQKCDKIMKMIFWAFHYIL